MGIIATVTANIEMTKYAFLIINKHLQLKYVEICVFLLPFFNSTIQESGTKWPSIKNKECAQSLIELSVCIVANRNYFIEWKFDFFFFAQKSSYFFFFLSMTCFNQMTRALRPQIKTVISFNSSLFPSLNHLIRKKRVTRKRKTHTQII